MTLDEALKIPVDAAGLYAVIKGPKYRDYPYDMFCEIVARCDRFFNWGDGGNDHAWDAHVRYLAQFPERPTSFLFSGKRVKMYLNREHFNSEKQYLRYMRCQKAVNDDFQQRLNEWHERWGTVKSDYGILEVDCISSAYAGGPTSWFHPNGTIDGWTFAKVDIIEEAYNDLVSFNKAFPMVELTVSFANADSEVYATFALGQEGVQLVDGPKKVKIRDRAKYSFWRKYSSNHSTWDDIKFKVMKHIVPREWLDVNISTRRAFWVGKHLPEQFFTDVEMRELIEYHNQILEENN